MVCVTAPYASYRDMHLTCSIKGNIKEVQMNTTTNSTYADASCTSVPSNTPHPDST